MVVFFFHFICSPPTGISLIHSSTSEEGEGPAPLVEDRIIPDFIPFTADLFPVWFPQSPVQPSLAACGGGGGGQPSLFWVVTDSVPL